MKPLERVVRDRCAKYSREPKPEQCGKVAKIQGSGLVRWYKERMKFGTETCYLGGRIDMPLKARL